MRTLKVLPSIAAAALLAAGAFACSGGETPATPSATSNSPSGAGGGGTSSTTAKLSILLTDSPFSDAKALLVTFDNVSVHQADPGEWRDLTFSGGAKERTCDLKRLTGNNTDVLGVADLTAGKYTQIRLNVTKASIYFDKTSNATDAAPCGADITVEKSTDNAQVEIPSGEVKLNHEFTLQATGTTIKLDFDGDQSVRQTGSGNGNGRGNSGSNSKYMMTPVIRVLSVQ